MPDDGRPARVAEPRRIGSWWARQDPNLQRTFEPRIRLRPGVKQPEVLQAAASAYTNVGRTPLPRGARDQPNQSSVSASPLIPDESWCQNWSPEAVSPPDDS